MRADIAGPSRRDRVRAATTSEIIRTARRLLVTMGGAEVSLRAIAREMGMTAPAIYRYFDSHEILIRYLVADIFTELSDYVEAAAAEAQRAAAAAGTGAAKTGAARTGAAKTGAAKTRGAEFGAAGSGAAETGAERTGAERTGAEGTGAEGTEAAGTRPAEPGFAAVSADAANPDAAAAGLIAASQAFRRWAISHPAEFGLIFGSPLPGIDLYQDHPVTDDPAAECGLRFGSIFLRLMTDLWRTKPFDVPADDEVSPSLRAQLSRYRDLLASDLPLGAIQTFLRCWVLLYGTVSLEVFGHLRFALEDSSGMFELVLADLATMIGLRYPADG